ncbi:MAG: SPW repeat protein [Candidatus Binatia bacterium]|nr:SPW repeat protein [Candidatus Binatia bacterium]
MKLGYGNIVPLILGLWLLISPYVLGFVEQPAAYWNAMIVGALTALSGAIGLYWSWDGLFGMVPHQQKA